MLHGRAGNPMMGSRIRVRKNSLVSFALLLALTASSLGASEQPIEAIVLCYHVVQSPNDSIYSIDREKFREQMLYLATSGYNVIPLADLLDYVQGRRDSLPRNPVVITVDDGWRCTYTEIYPELKRLNFPFTVFIYPKFIGRTKNTYALSWDEVKEMAADGVDIQSHSFSHPFLTHRKNTTLSGDQYLEWLNRELTRSKERIEKETNQPVRFLAYPYGDYDSRVAEAVAGAGYDGALTCDYGPVRKGSDPFRMRRVSVYKDTSFTTFREHLGSRRLRIESVTPGRGKTYDPDHPVIEARIENFEKLDPESVGMSVLSLGPTPYFYNPEDGSISLVVRTPLEGTEQRVVVWGSERETGRRVEASWSFLVGKDPAPAPETIATDKSKPPVNSPGGAPIDTTSRQRGQYRR